MKNLGFVSASVSLVSLFTASAAPIPLYSLYRDAHGLTYNDMSLATVFYCMGAMLALQMCGRLSNYLGRKTVTMAALALSALACLVFLDIMGLYSLLLGRVLQGLSCGLATSAITSYVTDTGPRRFPWLTTTVVACAPMTGITVGAIGVGAIMEYVPLPQIWPFTILLVMLAVSFFMIVKSPETVTPQPFKARYLIPSFKLPASTQKMLPISCCSLIATWSLGGFYQSFAPVMATDQLGSDNSVISGLVLASVMVSSALGGPLTSRLSPQGAQRLGLTVQLSSILAVMYTLSESLEGPFLIASVAAGVAQGMAITGALRALFHGVPLKERAGIFAVVYGVCYLGAAVPSLVAGQLSHSYSLPQILVGYACLAAIALTVMLCKGRNPDPIEEEQAGDVESPVAQNTDRCKHA